MSMFSCFNTHTQSDIVMNLRVSVLARSTRVVHLFVCFFESFDRERARLHARALVYIHLYLLPIGCMTLSEWMIQID